MNPATALQKALSSAAVNVALLLVATLGMASVANAQAVYGVGQAGTGAIAIATSNRLFSINTTTGAATQICTLGSPSTAVSVSRIDG